MLYEVITDPPETEADTQAEPFLVFPRRVVSLTDALHGIGAIDRFGDIAEDDQHAVAFDLEQDTVVGIDARREQTLRLVDHLQEMA